MNKKNKDSLGFGTIVMMALVGIGASTVIYWGILGVLNVASRYSKFVKEVDYISERVDLLEDRMFYIDSKIYSLDGKVSINIKSATTSNIHYK